MKLIKLNWKKAWSISKAKKKDLKKNNHNSIIESDEGIFKFKSFLSIDEKEHDLDSIRKYWWWKKWIELYLKEIEREIKVEERRTKILSYIVILIWIMIALLLYFTKWYLDKIWIISDDVRSHASIISDQSKDISNLNEILSSQNNSDDLTTIINQYYWSVWLIVNSISYVDNNWVRLSKKQYADAIIKYYHSIIDHLSDDIFNAVKKDKINNWKNLKKEMVIKAEKSQSANKVYSMIWPTTSSKAQNQQVFFWSWFLYSDNKVITNHHVASGEMDLKSMKNLVLSVYTKVLKISRTQLEDKIRHIDIGVKTKPSNLKVFFPWIDTPFALELVYSDRQKDLALLKIKNEEFYTYNVKWFDDLSEKVQIWSKVAVFWYPEWLNTLMYKMQNWE